MNKKRISLQELFMNNKFLLVFSIFFSIVIWCVASLTVSPEDTRVIENVQVKLEQSEETGYQIFGYEETYVDVTVKGKRYLVSAGALSSDDITVVAKSGYVDYAGTQKLKLTASINSTADIKITNISETSIEVYYDALKTSIVPVEINLQSDSSIVPDGYINEDPIASVSNIAISGPATEINKIEKIRADAVLDYALTETTALECTLTPVTSNGSKARYITFDENAQNITVTIPVSKVVDMPLSVRFVNVPEYYSENMPETNYYPKTVKVAAAQSVIDEMESLIIGTIDFNELTNKNNKFEFSLSGIEEVKILDDIKNVAVTVNCYPMSKRTFDVPASNIALLNAADRNTASVIDEVIEKVTVIGPKENLEKIDESQILAKADLSGAKAGEQSLSVQVYLKDSKECWIYGTYAVKVRIR